MESNSSPVEMFFFPIVGGGHQIPMIEIARVFASHGAKATIIATPKQALLFQKAIDRDQTSGLPISVHSLNLPDNADDIATAQMSAGPFTDTSMLQEPLQNLLIERKPDCIVHDVFHLWSGDVIDSLGVTRIIFNGHGCFAQCVFGNIDRFKPQENTGSDSEPFVVPGLPDRIELTTSQLPISFSRQQKPYSIEFGKKLPKPVDTKCFGLIVNSFYELEPGYADYLKMGKTKAWLVGPVSLCFNNVEEKAERGQKTSIDGKASILSWLDTKQPNSVLYISFGSLARLAPKQIIEIAYGLESAEHPFIWVLRDKQEEAIETFIGGFDDRIQESKRGLIIRGWAPQLLILEHQAVGGLVTHCGWNSILEGVSAGLPMITWPISAEQFINEKLIADVLRIGVKSGNAEWSMPGKEPGTVVGRERVEEAVRRVMGGGEEAAERRRRAEKIGDAAKRAVEGDGSSFKDADALIRELKSRRK